MKPDQLNRSTLPEQEEVEMIERLADGDQEAFTFLYNRYQPLLSRLLHVFGQTIDPREIIQDVFYKVWLKRDMMIGVQSFKGYLFRMVRNRLLDKLKSHKAEQKNRSAYNASRKVRSLSGNDQIVFNELHHKTWEAINKLPPRQKDVLMLSLIHDLSRDEIAHRMSITSWTVDKELGRGTRFVRSFIARYSNQP